MLSRLSHYSTKILPSTQHICSVSKFTFNTQKKSSHIDPGPPREDYDSSTKNTFKLDITPKATTQLFINGEYVDSTTSTHINVLNPATQELITKVPETTEDEFELAISTAKKKKNRKITTK
eukprot:273232_1